MLSPVSLSTTIIKTNATKPPTPAVSPVSFSSLSEAIDYLITTEDPLVIGFGEVHRYTINYENSIPSTSEYFGKALSSLACHGFNLVTELLFDDPTTEKEIEMFRKKECGLELNYCPSLRANFKYDADTGGILQTLIAATIKYQCPNSKRRKKLNVYPAGLSQHEYKKYKKLYPDLPFILPDKVFLEMGRLVRKHLTKRIMASIKHGKVATYSGSSHNDLEDYENFSFVPSLPKKIQERYIEVDLLTGETFSSYKSYVPEKKEAFKKFESFIPESGAVLIKVAPKQYLILLP